jgi:hypothetical protein
MKLTPVSDITSNSSPYVVIDKYGRIMLSKAVRDMFNCDKLVAHLHVSYDPDNQRIGIGKPDILRLPDVKPHRFDTRGYTSAKSLTRRYPDIERGVTVRYEYDGKEYADGHGFWRVFKRANG